MIRIGLAIFIFFIIGALFIISNNNLQLADSEEFQFFVESYKIWLVSLSNNVKGITGSVIELEWIPHS